MHHAATAEPSQAVTAHHGHQEAGHQPWTILVLLCVAQFMVVLDITVVNVALPSIGAELGFARADLQWVVTAYVLFAGGLLLLGGRAADLLGRRRIFLAGLLLFTAASLASGLAWSPAALIVARAAQGLGAAMLTPAALSIIVTTYTGSQHTTALSAWGAIASAGAAAGMLFGGMLTTWLSWEWVFLINVPVGLAAAAIALHLLPATSATSDWRRRLDLPGALSVVAGLVVLVYALEGTSEHGWGSARTLMMLGMAGVMLVGFATVERRVKRPLLPPSTWRVRSLVAGATVMFGATAILVGSFFLNSLYLQHELGATALETGLGFLPIALAIGLAAHASPHLLAHAGSRAVALIGLAGMAGAATWLAVAPDQAGYAADLLPGFLLLGLGVGLVLPAVSVTAMSEVTHDGAGLASGLMMTAHEIGAAVGVALLSAVAAGPLAGFAVGYGDAFTVAAAIAAGLAVLALVALPAVRPAAGARVGMH
jgi:EmrB/QacA subfamily drug resistance transporter